MFSKLLRATIIAGMFTTLALPATVTEVSLSTQASLGGPIYGFSGQDDLRIRDEFSRNIESPSTFQNFHLGGTAEVDVETGGFRFKSNVFSPTGGQPSVSHNAVMQLRQPFVGPPGKVPISLDMTVRFSYTPDIGAVGSAASAELAAASQTRQEGGDIENASYRYFRSEIAGSEPTILNTFTGDVLINSIFDVVLRTELEYECCAPMLIVASVQTGLSARLGGAALNGFDSAFLTLRLPPGYTLEPGSPFLSKPFEQPQPIPEPWMTPLLGFVLTSLAVRKGGTPLGRERFLRTAERSARPGL